MEGLVDALASNEQYGLMNNDEAIHETSEYSSDNDSFHSSASRIIEEEQLSVKNSREKFGDNDINLIKESSFI